MSAWRVAASGARGTDRVAENSRVAHVVGTHVPSARTARWTAHCHAATACVLTRAYQGDHRRHKPDSHHARGCHTSLDHPASHPVDKPFHIRVIPLATRLIPTTPEAATRRSITPPPTRLTNPSISGLLALDLAEPPGVTSCAVPPGRQSRYFRPGQDSIQQSRGL